jgi:hypothetical protein
LYTHLAAHAQMSQQHLPLTEIQPEVLAAALGGSDVFATEPGGEV